jgi:antitoxin ChpS
MLAIPRPLLDELKLDAEAGVDLSVRGGQLIIDPKPRRRYTLKQLLAECDPKARRPAKDRDWLNSPAIGRELI